MKLLSLLLALALLFPGPAFAAHVRRVESIRTPSTVGALEVMAEEALVMFDETTDVSVKRAGLAAAGMEISTQIGSTRWHLVFMSPGMPVMTGLSILRGLPGVLAATVNRAYRLSKLPSDPQVPNQYHLSNVNAFSAWEYETGSTSDVVIVVMDTGIDGTHPDLAGKLVAPHSRNCQAGNCATAENPPTAECNHGTRVAGSAAAVSNNGVGVAGLSWGAHLVSLKIFDGCDANCGDAPECTASDASVIAALNYANNTLRPALPASRIIVNMSFGTHHGCDVIEAIDPDHLPLQGTLTAAHGNGLVLMAATGNNGADTIDEPANCLNVIPVGATDSSNAIASFSNRGTELALRGLVGPGVGILTTDVGGGYASANGTSFSSPIMSGIAALILSAKPALTPDQVRDTLRNSASNIGVSALQTSEGVHPLGNAAGAGLVNAYSAMRLAITGSTEFDGTQKAIAFPNPFRPVTNGTVSLTIPRSLQGANAAIKIYTLNGQLVKSIKGLSWDGKNEDGMPVATGTYVFLVSTDNGHATGRLALIR